MVKEIWKDITGYEGHYQVSNLGRIKSLSRLVKKTSNITIKTKTKILKAGKNNHGYLSVMLCLDKNNKTISVHRLVAKTFIDNPENKLEVNHINGMKIDNRVENLEWCTRGENNKHAYKIGLKKKNYKTGIPRRKIRCIELNKIFQSIHEASRFMGLSVGNLCSCLKGVRKKYGEYTWEYVND